MKLDKLKSELEQFQCTKEYHKHWFRGGYTDGVDYLADKTKGGWLIDAIFSYAGHELFQIWELEVNRNGSALLTMKKHANQEATVKKEFKRIDFPVGKITLYVICSFIMLPSEYNCEMKCCSISGSR
jgi:hypothetical protein